MSQKKYSKKTYKLKTIIILLVGVVVLIALFCTSVLVAYDNAKTTKASLEDKVWTISTSFARSPVVIEGLAEITTRERLQEYAQEVLEETGVDYIVVMDMDRIRITHPTSEQIGKEFVGNDEQKAFQGDAYASTAEGTLGESLRAFIPIEDETGEQVGVVAVGILTDQINEAIYRSQLMVWLGGLLGLIPGIIGAVFLASKVKKSMQNLEPVEITQLLQTREAMLSSVQEGIIAINSDGEIILVNDAATSILHRAGYKENPLHQKMVEFLPDFKLHDVLDKGKVERNQHLQLNELELVVNRVPVDSNGIRIGAMATFQDKTELILALDQLSGVKTYAEALRMHTHEFMNKLHVVSAMVHTESYEELQTYIKTISTYYQEDVGWIARHLNDPVLVGYLLNKLTMVKNKGIEVSLSGDSAWPVIKDPNLLNTLITVIGNSLDNASEALTSKNNPKIKVTVDCDEFDLLWKVEDNGIKITQEKLDNLVSKGSTTKGSGRGYGLHLMYTSVTEMKGDLVIKANEDEGVTLTATVPLQGAEYDKRINS
ncbi:DcuS/MalK family sensor histidine kinase [Alkalicoccobacillus murimartini]|uniref:CitB family two-component system sensor histidine kinase MalK n=1 Tax=Alkalicoccobacillus murimartini TaxID=171685 RepID=A0ABT9YH16_9BACI|nr:DcuS/MalK family sensor histidine kinase [Alkalicoccobacillus murimartini]MDQ0207154.1 CitB family two-component system sensor histidine kinase MalK [Alkalicoccobacillus murimartini]